MEDNNRLTIDDVLSQTTSLEQDILDKQAKWDRDWEIALEKGNGKADWADLPEFKNGGDSYNKTTAARESLKEIRRLRDEEQLDKDLLAAKISGNDEAILKASQESLRIREFKQSLGDQLEAAQLAQRTLYRERLSIANEQQASQASIQNMAAQRGISNASAIQGMLGSITTNSNVEQSYLASDSNRLATNLTNDLEYLNETFDLGGDIGAASQSIANRQAREAQRRQDRADSAATASAIGTIGGYAIGGPAGAIVGGAAGSIIGSVFG